MVKNVIIIGAGPAGVTAAYNLLEKSSDYNVLIFEESDEIGGISKTVKHNQNRMDIGGHRFFSKNEAVVDFWKKIMPIQGTIPFDYDKTNRDVYTEENGPNPNKKDRVLLVRNRISRIYYLKKFFDYPISLKIETFKNLGLKKTIESGLSYSKTIFLKKEESSLENFYINRFGKKLYSMFFEKYTEKLWGKHPKDISADWGAQRVKGLSIFAVLKDVFTKTLNIKNSEVETSLIEEFYYPKLGPGQFWEIVAKEAESMGAKILMNSKVEKINFKDNKIVSVESNGKIYEADIFISSVPLKDLINFMDGNKEISEDIYRIANGLPYRDFITVGLLVDKLKLQNNSNIKTLGNIVPDNWIYIQEEEVKVLRLQIFNNWSPFMVKNPEENVWIGAEYTCIENDKLWNMSEKELKEFVSKELNLIGILDDDKILDYHVEKVKKAYPSYFDTYSEIDTLIEYLDSFSNLYCIGRNGQHRYNNMDHSMITAFETVNNILNNVKNNSNIWNVNTEKSYHEKK